MMAIQMPAALQFKQIAAGRPKGTKAHAVHIMVGATQATDATLRNWRQSMGNPASTTKQLSTLLANTSFLDCLQ